VQPTHSETQNTDKRLADAADKLARAKAEIGTVIFGQNTGRLSPSWRAATFF
jgi:hypothetical protein